MKETQMSIPPEATRHHNLTKLLILVPIRADLLCTLHYETPCTYFTKQDQILICVKLGGPEDPRGLEGPGGPEDLGGLESLGSLYVRSKRSGNVQGFP